MGVANDLMGLLRGDLVQWTELGAPDAREIRRALSVTDALKGLSGDKLRLTYVLGDFTFSYAARKSRDIAATIILIVQQRVKAGADGSEQIDLVERIIRRYSGSVLAGRASCAEVKAETLYDPDHANAGVFTAMVSLPFTMRESHERQ